MGNALLKRREIMKAIPGIRNKNHFFDLCRRISLFPKEYEQEGHVQTGLYSNDAIALLKNEISIGDRRKR